MLTYDEIIEQIKQLTTEERLALIEAIIQMLREDLQTATNGSGKIASATEPLTNNSPASEYVPFIRADLMNIDEEALKARGIVRRGNSIEKVRSLMGLTENDVATTTAEEDKEDYINYLIEKYK